MVTVTLTDSEGLSATQTFNVTVVSADVALTEFYGEHEHQQFAIRRSRTPWRIANAGPFNIDIYTSPDGSTPDQLLMSYPVTRQATWPRPAARRIPFRSRPQFDDIQSNYHLIAVADANGATSGIEFAGGIFYAQSVTASPPQNILYVFGQQQRQSATGAATP